MLSFQAEPAGDSHGPVNRLLIKRADSVLDHREEEDLIGLGDKRGDDRACREGAGTPRDGPWPIHFGKIDSDKGCCYPAIRR